MAEGDVISCKSFASYVISQEPVFDKELIYDIRPFEAGLMGYYKPGSFDAYSGVEHTVDRFHAVFPNTTTSWQNIQNGSCVGTPCDMEANRIGMGNTRATYRLEGQAWESDMFCFDLLMTKTRAKESLANWISDTLRPATNWITNAYLQRKAMELAGRKIVVTTPGTGGLPEFNFTWDAGAYVYLNVTDAGTGLPIDPTGILTANILQREVFPLYAVGATKATRGGYEALQLHTDIDTFHYLAKEDPILLSAWRFATFAKSSEEFYKYGFYGTVGDYMVKVLQFQMRFNRVSAGRYQIVLPYVNVPATEGIKSIFNTDYQEARYTFSMINNPNALQFKAFNPEAVNPQIPFMVRSYGGNWKFATHDLGADCNGRPIDNIRQNKGKFFTDFRWAIKPVHAEWLVAIFHMRQAPCLTIVTPCGTDPGYPEQSYDSVNALCPTEITFTATAADGGTYKSPVGGITCNGNVVAGAAIDEATFADFVTQLGVQWTAAGQAGTWAVTDAAALTFTLSDTTCTDVGVVFSLS